jgi:coenzyme F420-reducing hydrogenase alpha subunit
MKYTIIDTKSFTRKSTGERYETKTYSETIDELVDKYPHNDIYVYSKSLNTPNLEVILTPKYRIVERKLDNGAVEYFPQFYNNLKEEWSNISETYIRIIGCGYTDLDKAKECIEYHKLNGEVIKSSYVEKSIYF